jgi:hypothetical protein
MKYIYSLLGLSLCTFVLHAQKPSNAKVKKENYAFIEQTPLLQKEQNNKITIWSNDFSASGEWVISNNTNDNQDWVISTSTSTSLGYGTGAWVDGSNTVSNENGYALFDSDAVGSNGGNQDAIMTFTGSINCSAYTNVILEFNQRIRMWTTTQTIFEISNDGGTVWIPFEVNSDKPASTLFQESGQVNISSAAGGQTNVKIRLRYIGAWDYAWLVDDLKIIEQPANDIRSISPFFVGTNNEGIEYGRTPIYNIDNSYDVGGYVYNFGAANATNVAANIDFNSFDFNYTVGLLNSGDTLLFGNTETPTLSTGLYTGLYKVTSTEEAATSSTFVNNIAKRNFEITTNTYSIDGIGVNPTELQSTTSLGSNSFDTPTGTIFANMYHLRGGANSISSIEVLLGSTTTANTQIQVAIIDTAVMFADSYGEVTDVNGFGALSNYYVITAADIAAGKAVVNFDQPITLNDGAYYAAVLTEVNAANIIRILDDQTIAQPWYASVIHLIADGGTYSNGNALGIRMITSLVGLDELVQTNFKILPNPASTEINILFDESIEGEVSLLDISGKKITTVKVNGLNQKIDTSNLNNGVYYVIFSNGEQIRTEKVVINK